MVEKSELRVHVQDLWRWKISVISHSCRDTKQNVTEIFQKVCVKNSDSCFSDKWGVWLLICADDCCDFLLISWQSNASLEDTLSVIVTQCDIACHCCDTSATSQHQKSMSRLSLHPSLWHQYLLSFPDHGDHFFWKMSLCRKVVLRSYLLGMFLKLNIW